MDQQKNDLVGAGRRAGCNGAQICRSQLRMLSNTARSTFVTDGTLLNFSPFKYSGFTYAASTPCSPEACGGKKNLQRRMAKADEQRGN